MHSFYTSEGESGVCANKSEYNISPGREEHPLIVPPHRNCETDYKGISALGIGLGEKAFFESNKIAVSVPKYQVLN